MKTRRHRTSGSREGDKGRLGEKQRDRKRGKREEGR